jgi:hypothetical protein
LISTRIFSITPMPLRRSAMPRKKDRVDEAIAAGAFVLPPKLKAEQAESVEPAVPVVTKTPDPPYMLVERKIAAEPFPKDIAAALAKRNSEEAG